MYFSSYADMLGLFSLATFVSDIVRKDWQNKPGVRTVYAMTILTFAFVVSVNSVLLPFRQKSPDMKLMLMPLTLPIVLVNSHKLR